MRLTVLRMISTQSLSAFSGANAQRMMSGVGAAGAVHKVAGRAPAAQPGTGQAGGSSVLQGQAQAMPGAGSPPTGRMMPRGSLLDLSV